jgi:SHS2 domain-containing protein
MSHSWADSADELALELEAASPEEIFAEAAAALGELVADGAPGAPVTRTIELVAPTYAELLAAWLEELVFLVETESFVPERAEAVVALPRADGTVSGRRGSPRHVVEAVTYHQLSFEHDGGAWRARVVFDAADER